MDSQGVCLIAVGMPCFGVYAYNLAVSLKFCDPAIKIAVFCQEHTLSLLTNEERSVFDQQIEIDNDPKYNLWHRGQLNPIGFKLRVFRFSPFERTIYLDADSLWISLRPISSFFDAELGHAEWACLYKGRNYDVDAQPEAVLIDHAPMGLLKRTFHIPDHRTMHECHTQWLYAAKTDRTRILFNTAETRYDDCQERRGFQGSRYQQRMISDELILSVTTALLEEQPDLPYFVPTTDGSDLILGPDQVLVNIVGWDDTDKAKAALRLYEHVCGIIRETGFWWLPRSWVKKVSPY